MRTKLIMLTKLFASLLLLFPAFACTGPGMGLVGIAQVDGTGSIWTDGTYTLAIGDVTGEMGVFGKGTGFPLMIPFAAEEGMVYLRDLSTGSEELRPLGEPLPAWAAQLFRPGEALALGFTFEGD